MPRTPPEHTLLQRLEGESLQDVGVHVLCDDGACWPGGPGIARSGWPVVSPGGWLPGPLSSARLSISNAQWMSVALPLPSGESGAALEFGAPEVAVGSQ